MLDMYISKCRIIWRTLMNRLWSSASAARVCRWFRARVVNCCSRAYRYNNITQFDFKCMIVLLFIDVAFLLGVSFIIFPYSFFLFWRAICCFIFTWAFTFLTRETYHENKSHMKQSKYLSFSAKNTFIKRIQQ